MHSRHNEAMRQIEARKNLEIVKEKQAIGESCKTCKYFRADIEYCNKKSRPKANYYICHYHK